jgi:hypothetical protein
VVIDVIGGLTPLVATWLVVRTADESRSRLPNNGSGSSLVLWRLVAEGNVPDATRLIERWRSSGKAQDVVTSS